MAVPNDKDVPESIDMQVLPPPITNVPLSFYFPPVPQSLYTAIMLGNTRYVANLSEKYDSIPSFLDAPNVDEATPSNLSLPPSPSHSHFIFIFTFICFYFYWQYPDIEIPDVSKCSLEASMVEWIVVCPLLYSLLFRAKELCGRCSRVWQPQHFPVCPCVGGCFKRHISL